MQGIKLAARVFLAALCIILSGWSRSESALAAAPSPAAESLLVQPNLAWAWSGDPRLDLKMKYPVYNALDNDLATTWVANGQTAIFEYEPAIVRSIALIPGYAKSGPLWQANRRPVKIRFRLYREDAGGARAVAGPFVEAAIAAPMILPQGDGLWTRIAVDDTAPSVAIELQVVEGSRGESKSDDICISEIAVIGVPHTAQPKGCNAVVKTWSIAETSRALGIDLQDRLAAPFDTISFEDCSYEHSFTGGGHRSFAGKCGIEGGTKQGTGEQRYRFEGREELHEGTPQVETKAVQRTIVFRRFSRRLAVIDGLLYSGRVDFTCP
jgi:hypothetical protein